jgi:transposase
MARIAKKTKRYPSDLTDEEWLEIAPLMPKPGRRGRPREVEFREVINAVRYLVRSGCGWRMLPIHFGPWRTVYGWFRGTGPALSVPDHPRPGADGGS